MAQLITEGEITVEVSHETLRVRMNKAAIFGKLGSLSSELEEELELSKNQLTGALWDFGSISARCKVVEGKLDFDFAQHNDLEAEVKAKFLMFIDSDFLTLGDKIAEAINKMDRVQDIDLAPPSDDDDETKKKK